MRWWCQRHSVPLFVYVDRGSGKVSEIIYSAGQLVVESASNDWPWLQF